MKRLHPTKFGLVILFLAVYLFGISSRVAFAQVSASMSGRIEDPSGGAIPGASVTVTSLETGAARSLVVDEEGRYQVLSLPVGRYEVKAEKTGFKGQIQTGINLVVGQQLVVNLRLEVGTVQEQVTVTSEAPLVNTTTFSVAGLVGERQVKDLPLNGRSFDLLILLNPGAVNYTAAKGSGGGNLFFGGNLFSVSGRRPAENLTLLNGVQYSGSGIGINTPGGASGQLLGVDAVREYNVVSEGYGAEYGQRAGAQVSMVTQSGTNQLHGTVFEFLRNDKLDARNFFDQTIGPPPFKRNQFGGALGGPIRKDKTFIFGNYEGFRQVLALSNVTIVPDLNAREGRLPCGSGGVTCVAGTAVGTPTTVPNLDPRMLPFMAFWPLPNGPNLGGGVATAYSNPTQSLHEDFGTARFDQLFSSNDSLSAVYTISDGLAIIPAVNPIFAVNVPLRNQVASLQETHIFSPQVVNTFIAGFSRANYLSTAGTTIPLPASLNFVTRFSPGSFSISGSGLSGTGSTNPLNQFRRNLYTFSDGVQVIKGKHQISAGVWFQRIQQNDFQPLQGNGQATFNSFATFFQGNLNQFNVGSGGINTGWRSWEGAWYLQDSIQVRPNLTLRIGLRHEFSNGWSEVNGRAQTFLWDKGVIQTNPRISDNLLTENKSKWLFSPRVALAWDPFGKGKTSIRAGFGIYYNLVDWLNAYVDVAPPLNGVLAYRNVSLFSLIPVNISAANLLPACGPGIPTACNTYETRGVQSDFKVPTVLTRNFSVEQQLTASTALRLAYVGSQTYHQFLSVDPNTVAPQICSIAAGCASGGANGATGKVPQGAEYMPVGTRPNPYLGSGFYAMANGYGNYNSLRVEVINRLTAGLTFRANYTWAKNLDIFSASTQQVAGNQGSLIMNRYDLPREYGPASFDIRHQATGNLSYALPFGPGKLWLRDVHGLANKLVSGWQFNSIVSLISGIPFTVIAGPTNISGDGNGNSDRPNVNPNFTGDVIKGTPNQWFNPQAFLLPTPGTYGNVGRDTLRAPGLASVDFSLFKDTKISERIGLQFRAEVFNALNRANFSYPVKNVFNGAGTSFSPTAGLISSTVTSSRQIQFGLKLVF